MTMNFSRTLARFASPLPIYIDDLEGTYANPEHPGEWRWGEPVRRPNGIQAIVLALSPQTLSFYKEGNVADGGIALLTQEFLYFTDIHAPSVELNKQSIVRYQNRKFRVVGDGFISGWNSLDGNANFHCYHCLRYIE